jgi:hypothetical protein
MSSCLICFVEQGEFHFDFLVVIWFLIIFNYCYDYRDLKGLIRIKLVKSFIKLPVSSYYSANLQFFPIIQNFQIFPPRSNKIHSPCPQHLLPKTNNLRSKCLQINSVIFMVPNNSIFQLRYQQFQVNYESGRRRLCSRWAR